MKLRVLVTCLIAFAGAGSAIAQDVKITPDMGTATMVINGVQIAIERNQDQNHRVAPEFSKTSRACPPFCVQPMQVTSGVRTIGELELISFLKNDVASGRGLLLDSRLPEWFEKGSIPGAINLPFTTLENGNPYRDEILRALGATELGGQWDFSTALNLTLFCNGPWCGQSPHAIRALIGAGYPPEKLNYYRGGMQNWLMLGLSTSSAPS